MADGAADVALKHGHVVRFVVGDVAGVAAKSVLEAVQDQPKPALRTTEEQKKRVNKCMFVFLYQRTSGRNAGRGSDGE